jgi:hypothetical protein
MPKALLRLFLAMLTGMALVSTSAAASVPAPACGECCAYSNAKSGCASACAPAAPTTQTDEQSPTKAAGASCIDGPRAWFAAPAAELAIPPGMRHPPGPPPYLIFGRLLL